MILNQEQYQRMQYLLGKANREGLETREQEELRNLVNQENPSTKGADWGSILAAAAIIIGAAILIGILVDALTNKK